LHEDFGKAQLVPLHVQPCTTREQLRIQARNRQTAALMNAWFTLSMQMMKLGMESQVIILQRLSRLQMGGPVAQREAVRMVTEKATTAAAETFAMSMALASGKSPQSALESTVRSYRKKVAANRRRLGRSSKGSGKVAPAR
jgi:hypothetical protein